MHSTRMSIRCFENEPGIDMGKWKKALRILIDIGIVGAMWLWIALLSSPFLSRLFISLKAVPFAAIAIRLPFAVRKHAPQRLRLASVLSSVGLVIYLLVFEVVPRGDISAERVVNGIPFKEIAGTYYYGWGLSNDCAMRITPEGRFFFVRTCDTGVQDWNKGRVSATDTELILHPMMRNVQRPAISGTKTVFLPVKWGRRIYLVSKDKIDDFCWDILWGREPRKRAIFSETYLRDEDWKIPCEGWPSFGKYKPNCVLMKPARARVVRIEDGKTGIVNLGAKDGLREGMMLISEAGPKGGVVVVTVKSVSENESTVMCKSKERALHVDQEFVSRLQSSPSIPPRRPRTSKP
jgi:hypothetical protein